MHAKKVSEIAIRIINDEPVSEELKRDILKLCNSWTWKQEEIERLRKQRAKIIRDWNADHKRLSQTQAV